MSPRGDKVFGGPVAHPFAGELPRAVADDVADRLPPAPKTRASDLEASGSTVELQASTFSVDCAAASGRYQLTAFHARGGMGEVWRCHDSVLGREVAIKRLVSERPAARERFLCEAQITGQLEHPGIVPVHDLGFDTHGKPYYVMTLVRGRTLKGEIRAFHNPSGDGGSGLPREVIRLRLLKIFLDLCNAVAYAHSRGVIHRDLKPDNVMLGAYGETVVLDWGLAKLLGQSDPCADLTGHPSAASGSVSVSSDRPSLSGPSTHTQEGSILGSAPYMPPEMAEGRAADVDQRTDVYLLGATLYEVLTGRAPREGVSREEMLELARSAEPTSPRKLAKWTPRALEAICLKAMSPAPESRYESTLALAEDVQRFIAGEPVQAYSEPAWMRAWRWTKRHRVAIRRAAAVVAIGVGLAGGTYLYREASRARALDRMRVDVRQVLHLVDEARFFAASTDVPSETTPYYDPTRAGAAMHDAVAAAEPWGTRLEGLELEPEREEVRRSLSDALLSDAQLQLNRSSRPAPATLKLIDRAETLYGRATPTSLLLRAKWLRLNDQGAEADRHQRIADENALPRQAHDLFLEGERERLNSDAPELLPDPIPADKRQRADALARAIGCYQAALRQEPRDYWSRFQLGRCYMATGRGKEAAEALGGCIALRPNVPWAYSARGLVLALMREFDQASLDFDRAIELDPDSVPAALNRSIMYRLQERPAAAATVLDMLLARPRPPVEAAFYRAQLFLDAHDPSAALTCLSRVPAGDPYRWAVIRLRAQAHFLLRESDEAVRALEALVPDSLDATRASACRGKLLRSLAAELPVTQRKTALRLAAASLSRATERADAPADALADLGTVLHLLGQPEPAIRAFTRAIAMSPADPQLRVNRGWAHEARNDLEAAATDCVAALALDDRHPEALVALAYIDARRGRASEAQRLAALALLHGATDYLILHNVACVYAALSVVQPQSAAEYEDAAIDLLSRALTQWRGALTGPNESELIRSEVAFPPSMRAREDFKRMVGGN